MTLAVRSALPPAVLGSSVKEIVSRLEATQPVHSVRPMNDYLDAAFSEHRFTTLALGAFAALALALAALGIYAVMAFSVAQQTRELGVRLVLGASPSSLLRGVLRQGAGLVVPGLVLGLGGALAFSRVLRGLLFDVSPTDVATFAVVAGLLGAVAVLACWLPARRAARLDPSVALREE
jgi:putative ABC transport system permease protein